MKIHILIIFLIVLPICYAEDTMPEAYKEEIINRVNQHTDDQLNGYIDQKLNSNFEEKKTAVLNDIDQRINSFKFFLKMFVIALFGSVFMALCCYLYIKSLSVKNGN